MVKPGYRQTEVGVIPEDWSVVQIKDIVEGIHVGGNYKCNSTVSPFPLIKMGNIQRGFLSVQGKLAYVQDQIPVDADRLIFGDVLFNTRNTPELVGKVGIWKSELPVAFYNSNILRFSFIDGKAYSFFYNYVFNTSALIHSFKEIAKGTTSVAAIYPDDLLKVKVFLPPFSEQEKMAEVLSDADDLIALQEKLIAKKKAIKQGAMEQLLAGKKRLPGFSGAWKTQKIGEYTQCIRGVSYHGSSDLFEAETAATVRLLRSNNIQDAKFIDTDVQLIRRTRMSDAQALTNGDILVCMANGSKSLVGKSCILNDISDHQYTFGAFMSCIRAFSEETNARFIFYLLNSPQYWKSISILLSGSSINNLRPNDILDMEFQFPSRSEQAAIANFLSDMDSEIHALEEKLAKYRRIKQGMMQQLLTGKIRLV